MSKIIPWLISLFTGNGTAHTVGNAVVNVATVAALTPAAIWFIANKDVIFLTFEISYGQFAFGSAVVAALLKFAHIMRRGSPDDRKEFQ
jgi:hypothetical protein